MSVDHNFATLENLVDRKHLSAIAGALQAVLRSRRRLLALKDKTTLLSDERYFEYECNLNKLRRRIADAGCSNLRRRSLSTAKETIAYAAIQTLAREREVREPQPDSLVASAPAPLLGEASAARLADVLTALKEFLAKSTAAPQPAPAGERGGPPR